MLQVIRYTFDIGILAVAAYFAYTVWDGYRDATGTTWQRLLAGARSSATILWAKFCLVLAGLTGNLDTAADLLGQPDMKQYINAAIGNPKTVAIIMVVIPLVSILARRRTLPG
jgi:hypothetical protein